ncbi:MAG: phospholipase [Actinobacteria bacterium]|nr:phospholipase [Actinomycetota bacterium]MCB9412498.1 phospholipase [Actinomycetota bacterium]
MGGVPRWAKIGGVVVALAAVAALVLLVGLRNQADEAGATMYDGRLVAADYWTDQPEILSAGLGFDGIIATAGDDEASTRAVGGAFDSAMQCRKDGGPTDADRSSVAPARGLGMITLVAPGKDPTDVDGLPVVFSWPIRTDTLDPAQFRFTLNTGEVVGVDSLTMTPNFELNERNTVVMFSDLGNRGRSGEPDAKYPVRLDIVAAPDGSELLLAGPQGDVAATGLSWTTEQTPYDSGPTLAGAKLNRVDVPVQGEGGVANVGGATLPNDEQTLYGDQADFRLRMLTTGGFSPDGVRGITPEDFGTFFRVHARGVDGSDVVISEVGRDYEVAGGTLRWWAWRIWGSRRMRARRCSTTTATPRTATTTST